jgi:2,3-bisphosphoglycerate-dependent phosphoglycerate mutase
MSGVVTLLLARHGESDWNRARRWQGFADRPLTRRGREQAAELAERLADIALDAVYSSDLQRARDTAAAVARTQGLEVATMRALREVDVGSWQGLTRDEAAARFPDGFRRWQAGGNGWDDGESYGEMRARVLGAVDEIAARHEGGRVLVVAHGGPIRAIHAAALGLAVEAYRRIRPVEPNARLSAVCSVDSRLTELCPAGRIDELLARDQKERREAAARPPTPAG